MTEIGFRDKRLIPLWEKVQRGKRLTLADGLVLFGTDDMKALGRLAATVQQRMNGDAVTFVLKQKIDPEGIGVLSRRGKAQPGAYDSAREKLLSLIVPGAREIHICGSLNPRRPWSFYLEAIRLLKEHFPQAGVMAFTAGELDFFRKQFGLPGKEVLRQLKAAGLDTISGVTGVFSLERIRPELSSPKIASGTWLNIHKAAHRLGIRSNATLPYGPGESYRERLTHLLRLREAQDETGGFLAFMPLPPGIKSDGAGRGLPTGTQGAFVFSAEDLKMVAVSRLMLDNIPHIRVSGETMTGEDAAAALSFGADDLALPAEGEKRTPAGRAGSPRLLTREHLVASIREAGKIPVERDSRFRPLDVQAENVVGKISYLNSVPFYNYFPQGIFPLLPAPPRYLGMLSARGQVIAAPFSLMDYLAQEDELELMDYCIASFDRVRSIMLFSRYPWPRLAGKKIGIIDDTATSVHLLRVLLEKKYAVTAELTRMQGDNRDYQDFDAVLLIGDEALRANKSGLKGFAHVSDLAVEWYEWQKMPFVFAVWAVRKLLPARIKKKLGRTLEQALAREEREPSSLSALHGRRIGLTQAETATYLAGIKCRLGEAERAAIEVFRKLAGCDGNRVNGGTKSRNKSVDNRHAGKI